MNRATLADLLEGRCGEAGLVDAARDPRVRAALAGLGWPDGGHGGCDAVAAELYEIFGRSVFPFEGVFMDPEIGARGSLSEALRGDRLPASLRNWVPAFCCAVRDLGRPLGDAIADVLEELLLNAVGGPPLDQVQATPPPDLENADTDLAAVVEWLTTPSRCGLFLSAGSLERIGRGVGVPRGFGSRRRVLRQLLEAGASYGEIAAVVGALRAIVQRHAAALRELRFGTPEMRIATAPWLERLERTDGVLRDLAGRAAVVGAQA